MDRTNEALDELTRDFTSGPQQPTSAPQKQPASTPQTLNQPPGFQADTRITSANTAQPAPTPSPAEKSPAEKSPAEKGPAEKGATEKSPGDNNSAETPAEAPAAVPATPSVAATPPADVAAKPHHVKARPFDAIDQYLWGVYQRSTTKRDSSGDFTWKDEAAAARLGVVTKQYVIDGMDPDFRELLYNIGHAMDAAGLNWTILSGFRDDYRQGLASGYKAHVGNSFHGGSRATGGYGHGCAADIEASDGEGGSSNAIWKWVDQHGEKFGVYRPMKGIDPAHIQPYGNWHDVAYNLRDKRVTDENGYLPASVDQTGGERITPLVDTRSGVSEAQFDCVRSHRHWDFRVAGLPHHQRFTMGGRMHRAALFHPYRMHRFGRRRMVVESSGGHKRADAETVVTKVTDRTGAEAEISTNAAAKTPAKTSSKTRASATRIVEADSVEKRAKAEASVANRRDAAHRNADAGHPEQRPGRGKGASATAEHTLRNVKGQTTNGQDATAPKIADSKHSDGRHLHRTAADGPANQSKAKGRVAAHQDVSDKSDRKL